MSHLRQLEELRNSSGPNTELILPILTLAAALDRNTQPLRLVLAPNPQP